MNQMAKLLDYLKKHFPPRCIQPGEDRDKAMFYAGQQALAEKIRREFGDEEDDI